MADVRRIYVDTSVFGGNFDEEFSETSQALFELIREGRFKLVLSEVTFRELGGAPQEVRELLSTIPVEYQERIASSDAVESLRDAYVEEGVVGPASRVDAWHIAAATLAAADLIVSWNFKHIVHFEKIRGYHEVNRLNGYQEIPIYSPLEVV
jgi:predicted nucleic acid-binding protein